VASLAPRESLATLPFLSLITIAGLRSAPRGDARQSMITLLVIPVDSSRRSLTDTPSTRSSKSTVPSTSVSTGRV